MAQVINTNALSLMAQNNLNKSQSQLGTAIQRLSSGLRINSAKDDAAGLAITNRFSASIRGMTQAARNANDGISLAQTTEGALEEVTENVQRINELTVQAKNGTNSEDDRKSIMKEISIRLEEIQRVADVTNFNGVKVFDEDKELTIQIGDKDADTITINLKKLDLNALGLADFAEDFESINFNLENASQYDTKATELAANAVIDIPGEELQWKMTTAEADKLKALANADTADKVKVYMHEGNFFVHNETKDQLFEISGTTFTDDGQTPPKNIVIDNAGTAEEVTSVADKDMLLKGPTTLSDSTLLKEGDMLKALDGKDIALTPEKLDEIAASAFGSGATAESTKMKLFASTDDTGATKYYASSTDATTGEPVVKEISFATDTAAATVTDVSTSDAEYITKQAKDAAADSLLESLNGALTTVSDFRADLGAVQNRFTSIIANLNTSIINTSEARSRVLDADFSVEVSAMSRANILQQAGVSVLAQANQVPQNVLSLLR